MTTIVGFDTYDVRFPTSRMLDGSDAMNPSPDYSAAALIVRTDAPDGLAGHAHVFTIGRGNDIQLAAIRAVEPFLAGRDLDETLADLGGLRRRLTGDSPLRWLGPERGVVHMAIGAVLNACWDLAARRAGQPLWRLLAGLSPAELVALVDFRYLSDVLTPDEATALLERAAPGREARMKELLADGYPAYTTTPGWLGYSDERLAELCAEAVQDGFSQVKLKVGARLDDDLRRCAIARSAVGDEVRIALDANQVWDVPEAIAWVRALAPFRPAWIEEPTSPDDILGTAQVRRGVQPVAGGHRRARRQPGDLQAAIAGAGHRRHADRRVPGGRGQRERGQPAAGGQVRGAGLPARRRRGTVRDGAASVNVRLRRVVGHDRGPPDRMDRPLARALHRAGPGRARAVPDAAVARRVGRAETGVGQGVQLPGRGRLARHGGRS